MNAKDLARDVSGMQFQSSKIVNSHTADKSARKQTNVFFGAIL